MTNQNVKEADGLSWLDSISQSIVNVAVPTIQLYITFGVPPGLGTIVFVTLKSGLANNLIDKTTVILQYFQSTLS